MHSIHRLIAAVAVTAACSAPALAQVGVSVNVGEPGFFGSLDIGGYPPPQTINAQPVIVEPAYANAPPMYLRVPRGYEADWRHHCREYGACGRPVYFVRDDWYRNVYAPHYHQVHGRDEHRDYRGDDHRGPEERDHRDEREHRDER